MPARSLRAVRLVLGDGRVPKPLRWLAGVALLPIPGPLDELALLLTVPILLAFYRAPLRDAWRRAAL